MTAADHHAGFTQLEQTSDAEPIGDTAVTAVTAAGWIPAPQTPDAAAPLRAVDVWRADRQGQTLAITARLHVRGDDPNIRGHFPAMPLLPGAFIIEAVSQALALAVPAQDRPVLRAIRSVRFPAPVSAGDELNLDITAVPADAGDWDVKAVAARPDGTPAAWLRADFGPASWPGPGRDAERPARDPGRPAREPAAGAPVLDQAAIKRLLPHRHPLLLVDHVLELQPGRFIRTVKAIGAAEPCYASLPDGSAGAHYEYPRSLLIESLSQSAALLWWASNPPQEGVVPLLAAARDLCFEAAVGPGEVLRNDVWLDTVVDNTAFCCAQTWAAGRRVATATTLITTSYPRLPW
jgi:3-hydroxymyristoyl/3-hydroxydecanoyl-(acyl carrier protein) dehydratase